MIDRELEAQSLRLVAKHINRVQGHMSRVIADLVHRLANHDQSKFSDEEIGLVLGKPTFDKYVYMSPEERAALAAVKEAVAEHYAHNDHHPEHYESGVDGMSLMSLMEMACDHKAASEVSKNGSYEESVKLGAERFGYSPQLTAILLNTGRELGWIDSTRRPSLKRLVFGQELEFPEDVARMKRILNDAGYDTSPRDIQLAWQAWSDNLYAASWYSINGLRDDVLLGHLLVAFGVQNGQED
jgi:hypothetical protein